ncbi:MAG: hypothetical protein JO250_03350 [Armatimonadetes bacterium]|nr:hypothetical protein [Armatimonadota bacterium]
MTDVPNVTGVRDEQYNLISVLYHALQGGETVGQYIGDAEQAGDEKLAQFFRETQAAYKELADKAKGLLKGKLG